CIANVGEGQGFGGDLGKDEHHRRIDQADQQLGQEGAESVVVGNQARRRRRQHDGGGVEGQDGGQVVVGLLVQPFDQRGAEIALLHQLAQPESADGGESGLGGGRHRREDEREEEQSDKGQI